MTDISNKAKILNFMKAYDDPVSSIFLSKILSIKPSTVRSIVSRLSKEGKIIHADCGLKGAYVISPMLQNSTDGVEYNKDIGVKLQNIVAVINLEKVIDSKSIIKEYPFSFDKKFWKIEIIFGKNNKKLTMKLSSSSGFEISSVIIILDLIIDYINLHYDLKLDVKQVVFSSVELFKDKFDVRLSKNNITFGTMNKWMLKIYNKKYGVRSEQKSFVDLPYDFFVKSVTDPKLLNYTNDVYQLKKDVAFIKTNMKTITKLVSGIKSTFQK